MVLGNVEETITEVEVDPDTMEELVEVSLITIVVLQYVLKRRFYFMDSTFPFGLRIFLLSCTDIQKVVSHAICPWGWNYTGFATTANILGSIDRSMTCTECYCMNLLHTAVFKIL